MTGKHWTIFDSRLSNILILPSSPPAAIKFPSLRQTSIQTVKSIRKECQTEAEKSERENLKQLHSIISELIIYEVRR